MNIGSFVPDIIKAKHRETPWAEWLTGTVLFADVTGFTPLSDALSVAGSAGSERLTESLNRYFSRMVNIVHSCGGQVMKFGGDSILCLFTGEETSKAASTAAFRMQQASASFGSIKTPSSKFKLQMKIGIAEGDVVVGAVGDQTVRCDYIFAGSAVSKASRAEKQASSGQTLICDANRFTILKSPPLHRINKQHGFTRHRIALQTLAPFLIQEVGVMVAKGYQKYVGAHQRVVPAFLQFSGISFSRSRFSVEQFHDFFSTILNITHKYQGRLNSFNVDDKGPNFFFHFGAPNRLEKKEEAAAEWAVELREEVIRAYPRARIHIGMTEGQVFAGIVGGSGRFHYTVVGDSVNVAARLMQTAGRNGICVDEAFHQRSRSSFRFSKALFKTFRGKTTRIAVYRLLEHAEEQRQSYTDPLIGRTSEYERILDCLRSASTGKPQLFVLQGEAGAGKSFLASHILNYAKKEGWRTASGKSEITRRSHSYAPWLSVWEELILGRKCALPELQKMLHAQQRAGEESIKSQFHHQFSLRLLQEASKTPTCIFLDDLHFFDSLSLELLVSLLNHWKDQPLFLLAATRPDWQKELFNDRSDCLLVELSEFTRECVAQLASQILGSPARKPVIDFLMKQTQGNPFFSRQYTEYLKQNGLLRRVGGEWSISSNVAEGQSLRGEELIVAQIENLSLNEKIHLRVAACMGPTFQQAVLERALGKHYQQESLRELRSRGYLIEGDAGWLSFPHALVQDALYHSLTIRLRQQTHRRIGHAMESLLRKSDSLYYPNLANHFRLSGAKTKSIQYSLAAGEQLFRALSFPEARNYFQNAFDLLREGRDSRRWKTGLKLAKTLIHTGNTMDALKLARALRRQSKRWRLRDMYVEATIVQFDAMRRMSDYRYLPYALQLLKRTRKMKDASRFRLMHLAGSTLFWIGRPQKAEHFLRQLIKKRSAAETETGLSAHVFLATIAADRQDLSAANLTLARALRVAHKTGNIYQELRLRNEWAGILLDNGRVEEAKEMLEQLLPRAEALGDFYLVALILVGLGDVAVKEQQWQPAEMYLQDAVGLFSSLGLSHGKAKAILLEGVAAFYRQQYTQAMEHYRIATDIFEKGGEVVEACHGYYNLSEVCMVLGRKSEAEAWYRKGIESFRAKDNPQLSRLYEELRGMLYK